MAPQHIKDTFDLGFPWTTFDPFIFCVHHDDVYPAGNVDQSIATSLAGRQIGSDFSGKDGWSMYHGDTVPGFPRHPHRGFETISIVRSGYMDHSDSLGAKARFTTGDVQWMTAGTGIVHSEMFPLVNEDAPNPTGLFQLWLNLPRAKKMSAPHFSMLWRESIPIVESKKASGAVTTVSVIAGSLGDSPRPPKPPPESWATPPDNDVMILTVKMQPNAEFALPPASAESHRTLYFFGGESLTIGNTRLDGHCGVRLCPDAAANIVNGNAETELLLLQGRPIGEPVAHYGPFVMNTSQEIQKAFVDYRRTGYGGWPWKTDDPVHDRSEGRFALHADGKLERP